MSQQLVVHELIEVLDRFAAVSDEATRACAVTDVAAIERALEARDVVLNRARELLPLLPSVLPVAIRHRVERLVDADRDLCDMLSQALATIRRQLHEVGAQVTRVDGYVAAVPRFGRLDTLR